MWIQRLSSLQFFIYLADVVVVLAALSKLLPGRKPELRTEPYPDRAIAAHDRRLPKYFVAGGAFLVLGAIHLVVKNVPWAAEWLAGAGMAGHLVRDLANTHVMIVGGGTLLATGVTWYVLPRIVRRPLASDGLAQCAFWLTVVGLSVFYVALVANGIAMGRLVSHGWDYRAAKLHMGKWYRVPVGMGAGIMGAGYWCFAANVLLTTFHARLVRVPKPQAHLAKFLVVGASGLTVGTVQGVIQVAPKNADWLYVAGHAGAWIDPISHAHINLVTGLTMLVAGGLLYLVPTLGGEPPSRRLANACFGLLLGGSLAFYGVALFLGFHEGHLVVARHMTPEQAEAATPVHPFLIMGAGIAMLAGFWLLLAVLVRAFRRSAGAARPFVLAGCGALAVGTLQGPIQAFPAVNHLLDDGGEAGDVIVNLHAQLNMLGGLMVILMGLALMLLCERGAEWPARAVRRIIVPVSAGIGTYYVAGIAFSAAAASRVAGGATYRSAVTALEPWQALVLVPAGLCALAGFAAYARAAWGMSPGYRQEARHAIAMAPARYTGRIPKRVRRRKASALAGYELPLALLGFPGVGWLFAGFPFTATILLLAGPAIAWALLPLAFSPYGGGPLRGVGWQVEFAWLPASAVLSTALLWRAHRRRLRLLGGPGAGRTGEPTGPRRRRGRGGRSAVAIGVGALAVLLVSLPLAGVLSGAGSGPVRYGYETRLTPEITGAFVALRHGVVRVTTSADPAASYPSDALRVRGSALRGIVVRAAAVDAPGAYRMMAASGSGSVALAVARRSHTSMTLVPRAPVTPGRYVLVTAHEGMFGGRDFTYLTVVGPHAAATPIARRPSARPGASVADAEVPLLAALVAALFCVMLVRSYRRRPAAQKLLWATGFLLFGAATAAEAVAHRSGWTPGLFRAYYLAGGTLTVAYLGAGSASLLLGRRGRDLLFGALAVATIAAAAAVLLAPVDTGALHATAAGHPPPDSALRGHAFLWAVALNSLGTLALLGGALLAVLRRRHARAGLWIAAGALVLAGATGMTRTGDPSLVYVGELAGIALMFYGFAFADRPPRPVGAPAPVAEPDRRPPPPGALLPGQPT